MRDLDYKKALACAVEAGQNAGKLMRKNLRSPKKVNAQLKHDIKLDLDVRCQKLIEKTVLKGFPETAVLGEEGVLGKADAQYRWVVDPIDGTVNFAYGIPHACTSIALQKVEGNNVSTVVGVVYDPFCDELWTAIRGDRAKLNGKAISVSPRRQLSETILAIGFAKDRKSIRENLPAFNTLVGKTRKIRIMGSAALALTYVASARFDAYVEWGLSLWDIAAGGLIVECAGGEFWNQRVAGTDQYRIVASNGLLRKPIQRVTGIK